MAVCLAASGAAGAARTARTSGDLRDERCNDALLAESAGSYRAVVPLDPQGRSRPLSRIR